MTTYKIFNRWDGTKVLFECEGRTLREVIIAAVESEANLSGANLRGADLSGANLSWADLRGANLSVANLRGADLRGADLRVADLRVADLREANLSVADLSGANLSEANLSGANLRRADLSEANLREANLREIREDFFDVLRKAPAEVAGLRLALTDGRINGSSYQGECACLVGTIANVRGVNYEKLGDLQPDASRPSERWFLAIRKGDTPEQSQVAAITVGWIDEFAAEQKASA